MSISYLFWKCYFFLFYINRTGYFRTWSTKYFLWLTLILTLFGLSHNFSVTLRIAEYVFYVYDVPLDIEETEFERRFSISQYKYRGSFSNMSSMIKCVPRGISGGMNLLSQMSKRHKSYLQDKSFEHSLILSYCFSTQSKRYSIKSI